MVQKGTLIKALTQVKTRTRTVSQITEGYLCPVLLIISLDMDYPGLSSVMHILSLYTATV